MRIHNSLINSARLLGGMVCATALLAGSSSVFAQGCIIARGGGGAMVLGGDGFLEPGDWQMSVAYRYFHSFRHFHGTEEQPHRVEQRTQVDNWSHFIDVTGTYAVNKRLWINFTLPFVSHERSSLYEHENYGRFSTYSGGLADIRFGPSFWLFNPDTPWRGNLSVGVNVKAPTGDYQVTDEFRTAGGGSTIRSVDTSIQPGDGGWGVGLDLQGFLHLYGPLSGYFNGSYLINPRESTSQFNPRQNPAYGNLYSVPDSYLARLGVDYAVWPEQGLSISFGGRIEGVPQKDLIGGDLGRRRPGYAISVEPGINWSKGRYFASLTAPVAVERNRQPDYGRLNGQKAEGDAAFADYTLNLAVSVRF